MKDLQKINGIYLGEITSIAEDNTKIKVKIPQFHNDIKDPESLPESYICSPMSVSDTSGVFIPYKTGDIVAVLFVANDVRNPLIMGAVHNYFKNNYPVEVKDNSVILKGNNCKVELQETGKIEISGDKAKIEMSADGDVLIENENKTEIKTKTGEIKISSETGKILLSSPIGDVKLSGVPASFIDSFTGKPYPFFEPAT